MLYGYLERVPKKAIHVCRDARGKFPASVIRRWIAGLGGPDTLLSPTLRPLTDFCSPWTLPPHVWPHVVISRLLTNPTVIYAQPYTHTLVSAHEFSHAAHPPPPDDGWPTRYWEHRVPFRVPRDGHWNYVCHCG